MRRGAAGALVALVSLGALTACSGDGDVNTSTDPVEVEVGKAFEWGGFSVDKGWELNAIERSVNGNTVTTPEVKGTITNDTKEERAALFEMIFSSDGDPVATVNCSAAKMVEGQSMEFTCPGLSATMPEDFDAVVVQPYDEGDRSGGSGSTSG